MRAVRALGLAAFLIATDANATNWVQVSTSTQGQRMSVDVDSIVRSGNRVTYWSKSDGSADPSVKWRISKQHWMDDCLSNTTTLLSWADYDAAGNLSNSGQVPSYQQTAKDIVPESVGDTIHGFVCGGPKDTPPPG